MDPVASSPASRGGPQLERGIGVGQATALNMIDMIGVGPFITIPLIITAMHGPQAMLGWIVGAVLVVCDGLVWSELGAAMPEAGGPVRYLRAMYGPKVGRWLSFLFVWQLTFSAPLSMASGCIGLAQYAAYLWPSLSTVLTSHKLALAMPGVGATTIELTITRATFVAMGAALLAVALLYRRITLIGRMAQFLWVGVIGTALWIILSALTHFDAKQAFTFPPGAFTPTLDFFTGLGAALLIAVYDYWGYYNICYLGAEVRDPARAGVSAIYLTMNVAILGAMPWQDVAKSKFIAADFMEHVWGPRAGVIVAVLMIWTAFASVFSLLLGYSRVPYAAAVDGEYFAPFAKVHPKHHFPHVSLLVLGGLATLFCLFKLSDVVTALVVIRVLVQFLGQTVGIMVLRTQQPEFPRPFRMWLYPLPALLAFVGFVYLLVMRPKSSEALVLALIVGAIGTLIYFARQPRKSAA